MIKVLSEIAVGCSATVVKCNISDIISPSLRNTEKCEKHAIWPGEVLHLK